MIRNPFARLLRWAGYNLGFGMRVGWNDAEARLNPVTASMLRGPR